MTTSKISVAAGMFFSATTNGFWQTTEQFEEWTSDEVDCII
jgi:hypothetical protein